MRASTEGKAKKRSFSDFIRNASSEEKAIVYEDVMRRASKRQADTVPQSFRMVERSTGIVWLHKTAPVWVVKYDGVPGSQTQRYDSWQAYTAKGAVPAGRMPWTVDNRAIGSESGYATAAKAFMAAMVEAGDV